MRAALGHPLLVLAGVGALGAAFLAGRWSRPAGESSWAPPASAMDCDSVQPVQVPRFVVTAEGAQAGALSVQDVRLAVRAELAQWRGQPAPAESRRRPAQEPARPAVRSPELLRGLGLIETAIHDGAWTAEHKEKFRALLRTLDTAQQDDLLGRLLTSINDGELKIDPDEGGPF
jgi:hypothetical protein